VVTVKVIGLRTLQTFPLGERRTYRDDTAAAYHVSGATDLVEVTDDEASVPLVIATMHREEGITGVHTHVRQLRAYLERRGMTATLVTPFSWGRALTVPVFGPRLVLERFSGPASVVWLRHWHEVFLRNALRRCLAGIGDCVVYAQGPLAARAALRARRGPHQRVIMAVHFRVSQADEWADKKQIKRDGTVFRAIRHVERAVIPRLDGLVYVSGWARDALLSWLPEAAAAPCAVIGNFVTPVRVEPAPEPLGDLVTIGNLEVVKNHRFLLRVLAEANRAGRPLTLDVFGEGPCRKDLLHLARSLGLGGQVRFRGFRSDVREFLPGYRAYVHASYSEACPLAIIEAMAAGLPVVAGNLGPISELCDDGVEGRFWPLDDPAQAAATLIGLLDCEPARAGAARAASERFRRDFDADLVAPRLLSFLGYPSRDGFSMNGMSTISDRSH
jgi:glycosyltransferase involved in cell wall biosynthesis